MIILAIETSCDDTCIAIIKTKGKQNPQFEILSNIIFSQVKLHAKYGGVYPTIAKREHQKNLPLAFKKALTKAKNSQIDLIAVTVGPGLEPCLWQGINFAKDLAKRFDLPIIPVNHIEAHILANFIYFNFQEIFPAMCLVVSGGHTGLILMKNIGKYKLIGETRDDAAGECFDKVARILGLGYPGGPKIAVKAAEYEILNTEYKINLPRPMIYQKNCDFSFSGLKTAVLYDFKKHSLKDRKSKVYIKEMCFETQQAIIDVLIKKTIKAAKDYKVKSVILGGGVSANTELKKQFEKRVKKDCVTLVAPPSHIKFHVPDSKFCTDNAVMVGITAFYHKNKATFNLEKINADANLKI